MFLLGSFYESCKLNSKEELAVSKDREPRYFDFIHQHEERLNLIYSRWEAQIANQNAANKPRSRLDTVAARADARQSSDDDLSEALRGNPQDRAASLFSKIGRKKATLAGMAIAFGSVLLASQCGKVNADKAAIANNSQKIARMSLELGRAAADPRQTSCVGNDDIYRLTFGHRSYHPLGYGHGSFIGRSNTISLTKHSSDMGQPDIRLRIDPNRRLSFGSTEHTNNMVETNTRVIDLNLDADNLLDRESANNYRATQEEALALQEELYQCYYDNGVLDDVQPSSQSIYAD